MNRSLLFVAVLLWSIVSFAQEKRSTFIKKQPLPMKVVNDFGKFLTKPEKGHLEKTLIALCERKGYSVVIITLPGLTDNKGTEFTIEETAQPYFNRWGIGDNVKNDGLPAHQAHPIQVVAAVLNRAALRVAMVVAAAMAAAPAAAGN